MPEVQVLTHSMWIRDLNIDRSTVLAYLQSVDRDQQATALVEALEAGATELMARRERFHRTSSTASGG